MTVANYIGIILTSYYLPKLLKIIYLRHTHQNTTLAVIRQLIFVVGMVLMFSIQTGVFTQG